MKKNLLIVSMIMLCASTSQANCNIPALTGNSYQNQILQQQYQTCLQNEQNQREQLNIQRQQLQQQQQQQHIQYQQNPLPQPYLYKTP